MKHATWMTTVVVGLVACSGTYVGGDLGHGGTAGADAQGSGGSGQAPGGQPGSGLSAGGPPGSEYPGGPAGGPSDNSTGGVPSWRGTVQACTSTIDAWIVFDGSPVDPQPVPGANGGAGGALIDNNRDLYAIRPNGTQLTRLTFDKAMDWQPSFSADGSALSFTSDRDGGSDVYVMNRAQRSVTKITQRGDAGLSSFSPNGQLLTFVSGQSIYTIKLDGSNETLIGPGENSRFISNDELAIGQNPAPGGTNLQPGGIRAVRLDGTGSRTLVDGGEGPTATGAVAIRSVSPAGDQIAYVAACNSPSPLSILAAPITGTTQACSGQPLAPTDASGGSYDDFASWGPDNAIVYTNSYGAVDMNLLVLTGPDLSRCAVTDVSVGAANPVWAPAGWQP